ncbi:MAG: lysophospholipid acyltransferase family protein [Bdellovibrionales bacterium]|nr:lysophospholipid acyltransferase family protein [Bdellovibrionales bacterium]
MLSSTWRKQLLENEELQAAIAQGVPIIFAHWHGHELAITYLVRRYKLATMTSLSKDGQIIDYVIRRLGGATSKGSSSKGAVQALKGLIRLMKAGHPASMAVDGPRGPIYQVKPGVFELSRLSGALIFPVGVWVDNGFVFEKSWNKAVLPKPWSKVNVCFGPPIQTLDRDKNPKDLALALELKSGISDACHQASKLIDTQKPGC